MYNKVPRRILGGAFIFRLCRSYRLFWCVPYESSLAVLVFALVASSSDYLKRIQMIESIGQPTLLSSYIYLYTSHK